jgi:hypothetical protein
MDKLGRLHTSERLKLTTGDVPEDVARERDEQLVARGDSFLARQSERPLAVQFLLQEVAEKSDEIDGRFLTQVLSRLGDEIRVLLIRGSTRELALVLTSIQQAEHWAIEHGRQTGSHTVLDRRMFQANHTEEP